MFCMHVAVAVAEAQAEAEISLEKIMAFGCT
jgi:hypothetical protein